MPVIEMQRYAELLRGGDATEPERARLLEEHRDRVQAHIADLHRDLDMINRKLASYRRAKPPALSA